MIIFEGGKLPYAIYHIIDRNITYHHSLKIDSENKDHNLMKHIKELIIAVLILLAAALLYNAAKTKERLSEYELNEKRLEVKFDSLNHLYHQADLHALQVMTELNLSRAELARQSAITEKLKIRYETLRNTTVPRLSDAQIDSAANALYPIR